MAMLSCRTGLLTLAALLIFPLQEAGAGLFGPSNYEECITDSMKGVQSDVAARAIIQACRKRFPQPEPPPAPAPAGPATEALPREEVERMDVKFTVRALDGAFYGDLYNGAQGWHVTELIISVRQKGDETDRRYRVEVDAAPLTTDVFEFRPLVFDKNSEWWILAARGYRPQ